MVATKDRWKRIPFVSGISIPFQAAFSREEVEKLREGLVPDAMEDKWFIYFEEPYLFMHHSWTGQPVYRVELATSDKGADVVEALCAAEVMGKTSAAYEAELLDYLIGNLLLGKSKSFPVPPDSWETRPGLLQHVIAGTGFPQNGKVRRKWWRIWPLG